MKKRSLLSAAFLAALLPCAAGAVELKGRVSESIFTQSDDAANQSYSFTRTRLYLNALGLAEGTDFHFDGQYRTKGSKDYSGGIAETRIDTLNLETRQLVSGATLTFGRQYIDPMPGAKVDGVNADFALGEGAGAGVFLGTKADPLKDYFTSAYTTYGLYGRLHEKGLAASAGVAASQYKGKEDEMYLFGSAAWSPDDSLSTYGSVRVDNKVTGDAAGGKKGPDITNLLLNANYRFGWDARVNFTYSQYRAVWLQESMGYSYAINHDINRSYRLYADYNFTRTAKLYTDLTFATRGNDGKNGNILGLGFKESDLFTYFYYNVAGRIVNYYTNRGAQGFLAIGADPREDLNGEVSVTYMTSKQDYSPGDLTQMIYDLSLNYSITKQLFFYGQLEYSDQKIPTLNAAKYKDSYKTTSVFLNLDYRF